MNFLRRCVRFFKARPFLIIGAVVLVLSGGGFIFKDRLVNYFKNPTINYTVPDVSQPTIVQGDLVLPKVMLEKFNATSGKQSQLHVLSANVFGVFDSTAQNPAQSNPFAPAPAPKLVGIRIMGEVGNVGSTVVEEVSPAVRFLDSSDNEIGRKVGRLTPGFSFFGVLPNSQSIYDIMVDEPPNADKMEIVLNTVSATTSAKYDVLKIVKKAIDVKTAVNQQQSPSKPKNASDSGAASQSAQKSVSGGPAGSEGEETQSDTTSAPTEIEYYTVTGSVQNSLSDPVSDVSVYVWVKDGDGRVFSFGRQDFKGDLIATGKNVSFSINLFPFKDGEKYASYEVAAWGKRYTF